MIWAWKILVSQAGRYPLNVDPKLLKPLAVAWVAISAGSQHVQKTALP